MPRTLVLLTFVFAAFCFAGDVHGQNYVSSSHGKKANLPSGCATCHQGHGYANTAMLKAATEDTCYACHGDPSARTSLIRNGDLSNRFVNMKDISVSMRKRFNHSVSTFASKRSVSEEENSCGSCHNPHYSGSLNAYQGVRGITLQGAWTTQVQNEHEVCFRCHSRLPDDPNKNDSTFRDIRLEFNRLSAVSRHPIGRSISPIRSRSVSLKDTGVDYEMTCSTCHGSSDIDAPKGVHGSDYPFLLKKNISIDDHVSESAENAALCYTCHERDSILNNESFTYHAEHVNGQFSATTCLTCHGAHGSLSFPSLIAFNPRTVSPTSFGTLSFQPSGKNSGICYLRCHNVEHLGWSYANETANAAVPTMIQGIPQKPGPPRKMRSHRPRPKGDKETIEE